MGAAACAKVSVGTLFAFTIVGVAVLIVRYMPPIDPVIAIYVSNPVTSPSSLQTNKPPLQSLASETAIISQPDRTLQINHGSNPVTTSSPKKQEKEQQHFRSLSEQKQTVHTPLLPKDPADWDKIQDQTRRSAAALGIFCICVGVLLISFSTSLTFVSSWFRGVIGGVGGVPLIGGTLILLLIPQDEARHEFGQTGGFLCPFIPMLPIISIMVNVYLLVNLGILTWVRVSIWLALGALVYLLYGINHSSLEPKQIEDFDQRT